jgi:hypothetical protein
MLDLARQYSQFDLPLKVNSPKAREKRKKHVVVG